MNDNNQQNSESSAAGAYLNEEKFMLEARELVFSIY